MANVRYKEIPSELSHLAAPKVGGIPTRVSIGLDNNIGEFYFIAIEDLRPFKNQARKHFDKAEIDALAGSIKVHGMRQPLTIIACEGEKGKYEVVSGERRLRAAQIAGLKKVPCILLKNHALAEEITLALDNDKAGHEATSRITQVLKDSKLDMTLKTADLPKTIKDPDQLIREKGIKAFEQTITQSKIIHETSLPKTNSKGMNMEAEL